MTERLELRLDKAQMTILESEAKNRHISVQDLIRVVILPDWFKNWSQEK